MNLKINKEKIKIFEVGAGDLFASKTKQFWGVENFDITLFEPNPFLYKSLLKHSQFFDNVKIHNIAIYNEEKLGKLVCAGVLSYLPEVHSPINTIYLGKLTELLEKFIVPVNVMRFDSFDYNDIDLLILGMEGAEFSVFQTLKSRPSIITLHNYFANDYKYTFPYFDFIQQWCINNNYKISMGIPDINLVNMDSINNGVLTVTQ